MMVNSLTDLIYLPADFIVCSGTSAEMLKALSLAVVFWMAGGLRQYEPRLPMTSLPSADAANNPCDANLSNDLPWMNLYISFGDLRNILSFIVVQAMLNCDDFRCHRT